MRGTARYLCNPGFFAALAFSIAGSLSTGVHAQTPELRDVQNQFIPEEGCPVRIVKAETRLEVDSFGAPLACRIYIDYTNAGSRSVNAVKFRIGYVDPDGKVRGMFHAPDGREVVPGSQASCKWRGEKIDPRTKLVKIRVLTARYSDGSVWESTKMKDVAKPPGADSGNPVESGDGEGAAPEPAPPARGSEGL